MEQTDLVVKGMTCDHCVATVSKVLQNISGVAEVSVSLSEGKAHVMYDPARTDSARLKAAIENAGYTTN